MNIIRKNIKINYFIDINVLLNSIYDLNIFYQWFNQSIWQKIKIYYFIKYIIKFYNVLIFIISIFKKSYGWGKMWFGEMKLSYKKFFENQKICFPNFGNRKIWKTPFPNISKFGKQL